MLLVILVLAHPLGLQPLLDGTRSDRMLTAAAMSRLLQTVVMCSVAILLKFEWRLSGNPATGWLAVVVAASFLQNLPFLLLAVNGNELPSASPGEGLLRLATMAVVLVLLVLAGSGLRRPPANPLLIGTVVAAAFVAFRGLAARSDAFAPWLSHDTTVTALAMLYAVFAALAVVALGRLKTLPGWVRGGLMLGFGLLAVTELGLHVSTPTLAPWLVVPGVVGVGIVGVMALTMFRLALRDTSTRFVLLAHAAARAAEGERRGQEYLHEVNATIAGIAAASRLMAAPEALSPDLRHRLQSMMDTETARLERIITHQRTPVRSLVSVDEVVGPLVTAQEMLGHPTVWRPCGIRVSVPADDLAEVLHILLENSRRHAPGAATQVEALVQGESTTITVSDNGPGVPLQLVGTLFDRGVRGKESPGDGLGLGLARRLATAMGGSLTLGRAPDSRGAAFILTLPSPAAATTPSATVLAAG